MVVGGADYEIIALWYLQAHSLIVKTSVRTGNFWTIYLTFAPLSCQSQQPLFYEQQIRV
jgi:hypothetical protein